MKSKSQLGVLLAHCQPLHPAALLACRQFSQPALAAGTLYRLRLTLRIFRILLPLLRKDSAYEALSATLAAKSPPAIDRAGVRAAPAATPTS